MGIQLCVLLCARALKTQTTVNWAQLSNEYRANHSGDSGESSDPGCGLSIWMRSGCTDLTDVTLVSDDT